MTDMRQRENTKARVTQQQQMVENRASHTDYKFGMFFFSYTYHCCFNPGLL